MSDRVAEDADAVAHQWLWRRDLTALVTEI